MIITWTLNIVHCILHTHTMRTEQMPYMELHRSNALAYGIQNNITTHYIKQYGIQIQSYAIYFRDCTLCLLLLLFFCLFIKTFFYIISFAHWFFFLFFTCNVNWCNFYAIVFVFLFMLYIFWRFICSRDLITFYEENNKW